MGRTNRSRKRREKMNKIKQVRYEAKELARLKKTLGIIDPVENNETMKDISEVATIKTAKELKIEKKTKEEQDLELEIAEERDQGEAITLVNEKTGKSHTFNSKSLKDEHGTYPAWHKSRKSAKRLRKKEHSRTKNFKQTWTVTNVPL